MCEALAYNNSVAAGGNSECNIIAGREGRPGCGKGSVGREGYSVVCLFLGVLHPDNI